MKSKINRNQLKDAAFGKTVKDVFVINSKSIKLKLCDSSTIEIESDTTLSFVHTTIDPKYAAINS